MGYSELILTSALLQAKVWEWGCSSSIYDLSSLPQIVASRYSDFESANDEFESAKSDLEMAESGVESKRRMFDYCSPTKYNDCEFERMQLNSAINDYNASLEAYQDAQEAYNQALDDLITMRSGRLATVFRPSDAIVLIDIHSIQLNHSDGDYLASQKLHVSRYSHRPHMPNLPRRAM